MSHVLAPLFSPFFNDLSELLDSILDVHFGDISSHVCIRHVLVIAFRNKKVLLVSITLIEGNGVYRICQQQCSIYCGMEEHFMKLLLFVIREQHEDLKVTRKLCAVFLTV